MLGGTLEVGKMQLYPGKGAFFGNTGDTEGVYYTRKQDKWTFRGGLANSSYLISSGQRVKFMEAQYKPNGKMDIGAYALRQSYSDTVDDLDLRVINGAVEITPKLALSFEYAHNNANPDNYAYGHASKPGLGTALGAVAKAIVDIETHPYPYRLIPLAEAQLKAAAAVEDGDKKRIYQEPKKYWEELCALARQNPELDAMLHTTFAFTMAQASNQPNVLPSHECLERTA